MSEQDLLVVFSECTRGMSPREKRLTDALVLCRAKLERDRDSLLNSVCRHGADGLPDRDTMEFEACDDVAEFDEVIRAIRVALSSGTQRA